MIGGAAEPQPHPELAVAPAQLTNDLRGVSRGVGVRWHVLLNDGTCTDDRATADSDPGHDDRAEADPGAVLDRHRGGALGAEASRARTDAMCARVDHHAGCNADVRTDLHRVVDVDGDLVRDRASRAYVELLVEA